MPYLLVRHKVADFSKWKSAYDAHLGARQKAEEIHKSKEFAGSSDLREAMQNAGVIDKPDIYFLS
jgi:hypothetical protein